MATAKSRVETHFRCTAKDHLIDKSWWNGNKSDVCNIRVMLRRNGCVGDKIFWLSYDSCFVSAVPFFAAVYAVKMVSESARIVIPCVQFDQQ